MAQYFSYYHKEKLYRYSKILHLYFTLIFARNSRVLWDEGHRSSDIPKKQDRQNNSKIPKREKNIHMLNYVFKVSYTLITNLLLLSKKGETYLTLSVFSAGEIFSKYHGLILLLLRKWLKKPVHKGAVTQGLILTSKILPRSVSCSKVHWSFQDPEIWTRRICKLDKDIGNMEELVTEYTQILSGALFELYKSTAIIKIMQINTFSLVYREKVILCSFIPIKIRGQILSWLLHLAMCSRTLRH